MKSLDAQRAIRQIWKIEILVSSESAMSAEFNGADFSVKTRSLPLKTAFEIAAFLQNALNATRLSFHSIMPGTVFGPHPKITKMDIARFAFKLFICGPRF